MGTLVVWDAKSGRRVVSRSWRRSTVATTYCSGRTLASLTPPLAPLHCGMCLPILWAPSFAAAVLFFVAIDDAHMVAGIGAECPVLSLCFLFLFCMLVIACLTDGWLGGNGLVIVFDRLSGVVKLTINTVHSLPVYAVALTDTHVYAAADGVISAHALDSGQQVATMVQHMGIVSSMQADSDILVSASFDRTLCLWNARDHTLLRVLTAHTDWVSGVALTPTSIVSCSWDGSVRVWSRDGTLQYSIRTGSWYTGVAADSTRIVASVAAEQRSLHIIDYWPQRAEQLSLALRHKQRGARDAAALDEDFETAALKRASAQQQRPLVHRIGREVMRAGVWLSIGAAALWAYRRLSAAAAAAGRS